jgi:hypothetical protein
MRTPARLVAFGAGLAIVFAGAALAGGALDPLRDSGDAHGGGHGDDHSAAAPVAAGGHAPPGLAVADDDLRLVADTTTLPRAASTRWTFRIVDAHGDAVTDFDVEHEREMHLIVVRRDLTGYQHLHPRRDADGTWRVDLRLPAAGVYRAYADFSAGGRSSTLATDLFVAGAFTPRALPSPTPVDEAGGYRAELSAEGLEPGASAAIAYDLSRDGRPLTAIEPYLGADGHLVALREGDLAFLHVHPEESGTPGRIRFAAELPSAGRYRLFLQFRHDGAVRTVAHTLEVSP